MAGMSHPDAGAPASYPDDQLKQDLQDVVYALSDSNKIKTLCYHLTNEYSNGQDGALKTITHEKDPVKAASLLLSLIEKYLADEEEEARAERIDDIIGMFRGQGLDVLGTQIVNVISAKTASHNTTLASMLSAMPIGDSVHEEMVSGTQHGDTPSINVDTTIMNISVNSQGEVRESNPLKIEVKYNGHTFPASEKVYKNTSRPRGMVFLANYTFPVDGKSNKEYRKGAEVDEENIKKLFEDMGYIVRAHRNLSRVETKKAIREFKNHEDLKNVDCCFIIIMSHGKDNRSFYTADDLSLEEKEIETLFNNANCEALKGKPKIFIQQYCRGCMHDYGVPRLMKVSAVIDDYIETDSASRGFTQATTKDVTQSDMMFVYSTIEGYVSHRHIEKGSWFIEAFCKVLMEQACVEDFEAMLKEVDKMVSMNETNTGSKQGCEIRQVKFNKYFYLNPYDKNVPLSSFDFSALANTLPIHDRHPQRSPYGLTSSQSAHRFFPTGFSPSSSSEHLPSTPQGARSRVHSRPLSGSSIPSSEEHCRPLISGTVLIHRQIYSGNENRLSTASDEFSFLGESHLDESPEEHFSRENAVGMDTVDARSYQPLETMEYPDEITEEQSATLFLPTEETYPPTYDTISSQALTSQDIPIPSQAISTSQDESYNRRGRLIHSLSLDQPSEPSRLKRQLSVDSDREVLNSINKVKSYVMVDSSPDSEMVKIVDQLNQYVKEKKDKRHKKNKLSQSQ